VRRSVPDDDDQMDSAECGKAKPRYSAGSLIHNLTGKDKPPFLRQRLNCGRTKLVIKKSSQTHSTDSYFTVCLDDTRSTYCLPTREKRHEDSNNQKDYTDRNKTERREPTTNDKRV